MIDAAPIKLITRKDLHERGIRYTNVHLLRLENAGKFPRRVTLGHSTVAWVEGEIEQYIADAIAKRGPTYQRGA